MGILNLIAGRPQQQRKPAERPVQEYSRGSRTARAFGMGKQQRVLRYRRKKAFAAQKRQLTGDFQMSKRQISSNFRKQKNSVARKLKKGDLKTFAQYGIKAREAMKHPKKSEQKVLGKIESQKRSQIRQAKNQLKQQVRQAQKSVNDSITLAA